MTSEPQGAVDKSLSLLEALLRGGDGESLPAVALRLGLPLSTAHRLVGVLERHGFLTRASRGVYVAGPTILAAADTRRVAEVLAAVGRPILVSLAGKTRRTAHLGILEGDMVTYLLKAQHGGGDLFTREGMQLEAYCSGIGKVLLAGLPAEERDRYLAAGPFVSLTERTIVEPALLRRAMEDAGDNGYAIDDGEIDIGLRCIAVPVRNRAGEVTAAISLSSRRGPDDAQMELGGLIEPMREAAMEIERRAFGARG